MIARTGEFVAGLMHGKGTWLYSNGDRYDGDFSNGAASGMGTYRQASGDEYVGA